MEKVSVNNQRMKMKNQNNNPQQPIVGMPQRVGLNCPQCGTFIETSIIQLLAGIPLHCRHCGLTLNIDTMKSRRALDALQKVQNAKARVDRASKFNR